MCILSVADISKYYTNDDGHIRPVFEHLSFSLPESGLFVIFGDSGVGKSTLLDILAKRITVSSGEVRRASEAWNFFSYCGIENSILTRLSVRENIKLADITGRSYPRACELAARLNIDALLHKKAGRLSSGEKKRVQILLTVMTDAAVYAFDEPTSNLDEETAELVVSLLTELSRDRLVLVAEHNLYYWKNSSAQFRKLTREKLVATDVDGTETEADISEIDDVNSLDMPSPAQGETRQILNAASKLIKNNWALNFFKTLSLSVILVGVVLFSSMILPGIFNSDFFLPTYEKMVVNVTKDGWAEFEESEITEILADNKNKIAEVNRFSDREIILLHRFDSVNPGPEGGLSLRLASDCGYKVEPGTAIVQTKYREFEAGQNITFKKYNPDSSYTDIHFTYKIASQIPNGKFYYESIYLSRPDYENVVLRARTAALGALATFQLKQTADYFPQSYSARIADFHPNDNLSPNEVRLFYPVGSRPSYDDLSKYGLVLSQEDDSLFKLKFYYSYLNIISVQEVDGLTKSYAEIPSEIYHKLLNADLRSFSLMMDIKDRKSVVGDLQNRGLKVTFEEMMQFAETSSDLIYSYLLMNIFSLVGGLALIAFSSAFFRRFSDEERKNLKRLSYFGYTKQTRHRISNIISFSAVVLGWAVTLGVFIALTIVAVPPSIVGLTDPFMVYFTKPDWFSSLLVMLILGVFAGLSYNSLGRPKKRRKAK